MYGEVSKQVAFDLKECTDLRVGSCVFGERVDRSYSVSVSFESIVIKREELGRKARSLMGCVGLVHHETCTP